LLANALATDTQNSSGLPQGVLAIVFDHAPQLQHGALGELDWRASLHTPSVAQYSGTRIP